MLKNQDIHTNDLTARNTFVAKMKSADYAGAISELSNINGTKILNAAKINDITSGEDYGLDDLQTTALNDGYMKGHRIFLSYRPIDDAFIETYNIVEAEDGKDVYFRFAYNQYISQTSQIMQFKIEFGANEFIFLAPVPAVNYVPQNTTWRSFVSSVFNEILNEHTMFRIAIDNRVEIWDISAITPAFTPLVDSSNNFVYADTAIKNASTEIYKPYTE